MILPPILRGLPSQADLRSAGARPTFRIRPSAVARRSGSGSVGVVPPASNRAMPGWVIPRCQPTPEFGAMQAHEILSGRHRPYPRILLSDCPSRTPILLGRHVV
jgi:hypothetical protein